MDDETPILPMKPLRGSTGGPADALVVEDDNEGIGNRTRALPGEIWCEKEDFSTRLGWDLVYQGGMNSLLL